MVLDWGKVTLRPNVVGSLEGHLEGGLNPASNLEYLLAEPAFAMGPGIDYELLYDALGLAKVNWVSTCPDVSTTRRE